MIKKQHKIYKNLGFQKRVPWNKGTKGICKPNSGSFKKGQKPSYTPMIKGISFFKKGEFKKGTIPWNKGKKGYLAGSKHYKWNGGRCISHGYIKIWVKDKYILEHRLNVENFLKRKLTNKEVVHHINEIKTDNRLENLYLFPNLSEHKSFHFTNKIIKSNLLQIKYSN